METLDSISESQISYFDQKDQLLQNYCSFNCLLLPCCIDEIQFSYIKPIRY